MCVFVVVNCVFFDLFSDQLDLVGGPALRFWNPSADAERLLLYGTLDDAFGNLGFLTELLTPNIADPANVNCMEMNPLIAELMVST